MIALGNSAKLGAGHAGMHVGELGDGNSERGMQVCMSASATRTDLAFQVSREDSVTGNSVPGMQVCMFGNSGTGTLFLIPRT